MIQDNTQIVLTNIAKSLSLGQFPLQHPVCNDQVGGHRVEDILHVEIKLFEEDVTQLSAVVDNLDAIIIAEDTVKTPPEKISSKSFNIKDVHITWGGDY